MEQLAIRLGCQNTTAKSLVIIPPFAKGEAKRSARRGGWTLVFGGRVFFDLSSYVFFCTNERADGSDCCGKRGALKARDYMKNKVAELGISTLRNNIRINTAGCMNRCDEGPVIVVYPESTWYTFVDEKDLDEIIEEHLRHGRVVERLNI